MRKMKIFIGICTIILCISGCTNENIATNASKETIQIPLTKEEKAKELALSWYRENHYEYKEEDEEKYSFRLLDESMDDNPNCYPLIMYFNGKNYLDMLVDVKTNMIYYSYDGISTFIPLNKIKILDASCYEEDVEKVKEEVFGEEASDVVYCDAVERDETTYFVLGTFKKNEVVFQDVFMWNTETKKIYKWNLSKDILEEYKNESKSIVTD